jgi:hypothetical protein
MRARGTLAAIGVLLVLPSLATPSRAADKVRCGAAYEQGQELRRQDKLSAAHEQLVICEQTCPKTLTADCTKWRKEVEALMPTVRLRASDGQGHAVDARVLIDGTLLLDKLVDDPVAVDSGEHTFRFESASGLTTEVHVSLHGAERGREIEGVLAPPQPAAPAAAPSKLPPIPIASWVLGAVGGLGLGLGAVLSIKGHIDASHLQSTCAPGCAPSDVDSIATQYTVGWVSAGIGLAAVAAAVVVWAPWQRGAQAQSGQLYVAPTLGGAVVGWVLR